MNDTPKPSDELVTRAAELIKGQNQTSASSLQRKLRLGYGEASALLREMEKRGMVSPPIEVGFSARKVKI